MRELKESDLDRLVRYWCGSDPAFMMGMGVDVKKIPPADELRKILGQQLSQDYPEKRAYALIAEWKGRPIGHCNVNPVLFGGEARMHLHLWEQTERKQGMGKSMVKLSLPFFFDNLQLQRIWCEPYALNEAPNRTLASLGFQFTEEVTCVPGWINFEQRVKRWKLERSDWEKEKDL